MLRPASLIFIFKTWACLGYENERVKEMAIGRLASVLGKLREERSG